MLYIIYIFCTAFFICFKFYEIIFSPEFDKYLILDLINARVWFFDLINICCKKKITKLLFYFEPVQLLVQFSYC